MKISFFLILLVFLGVQNLIGQRNSSLVDNLKLSGYYENAFQILDKNGVLLQDYNKLRLNLDAKIDNNFSFNSNVIFTTYHGATTINVLDYLPTEVVNDYLTAIGQPIEAVESLFNINFENQIFLDNVYASYYSKHFNLRVGKQQLTWGSGYTWNPTNIFHIKNPLDPTYEVTGVNALKAELLFGREGMLTGIYGVSDDFKNSTYAVKLKNHLLGFDVNLSYVYYEYLNQDLYTFNEDTENRQLIGLDLSGSIFGAGFWSELAYNFKVEDKGGENYGRAVIGMDYTLNNGLYFMTEYYYNEKGKDDYADYDMNDWMWSFGQYAENLGKHYLNIGQGFPVIWNNMNWLNFLMINLNDKSGIIYPWINLSLGDNSEMALTAYIPFGDEQSEYGGFGYGGLIRLRIHF
jgi:hypothetical protein